VATTALAEKTRTDFGGNVYALVDDQYLPYDINNNFEQELKTFFKSFFQRYYFTDLNYDIFRYIHNIDMSYKNTVKELIQGVVAADVKSDSVKKFSIDILSNHIAKQILLELKKNNFIEKAKALKSSSSKLCGFIEASLKQSLSDEMMIEACNKFETQVISLFQKVKQNKQEYDAGLSDARMSLN